MQGGETRVSYPGRMASPLKPFALLLTLLTLSACAASTPQADQPPPPDWVTRGEPAFGDEQQGFYGVGMAKPEIADEKLRVSAAADRARRAVITAFERWLVTEMKRVPKGDTSRPAAMAALPRAAAAQVAIVETWRAPDGAIHVLARLEVDDIR